MITSIRNKRDDLLLKAAYAIENWAWRQVCRINNRRFQREFPRVPTRLYPKTPLPPQDPDDRNYRELDLR